MKHCTLFLLVVANIIWLSAFSQAEVKHQRTIGAKGDEELAHLLLTNDGGCILGGSSDANASHEKTQDSRGGTDYWIVKLNAQGVIEWDKTIGGSDFDYLYDIQQTTDSGYIIGGASNSPVSGEKTEANKSNPGYEYDYWIVKLDKWGKIQWDRTIGGNNRDELVRIRELKHGYYLLAGNSYSGISGDKTEQSKGGPDYWIVLIDSLGNKVWDKTIGGNNYDYLTDIDITSDDGCILGGYSLSGVSGDKSQPNHDADGWDYWIVKLNKHGHIEWDKTIGGNSWDFLTCIKQTNNGTYIAGGYSLSGKSGDRTGESFGDFDYWLLRLDSTGNIMWDRSFGGADWDELNDIDQTSDHGFIIAGRSFSDISGNKTENSRGESDYWVIKVNVQGDVQWQKTIGGSKSEWLTTVKETVRNRYVIAGFSMSGISGEKTQHSRGGFTDYWIVDLQHKPDNELISQERRLNETIPPIANAKSFTFYPNPAQDQISIQSKAKATFTLTNQQGKTIITKVIANRGTMDISHVSSGIYYLTNTTSGTVQKIMISR